jgi:hypothetical protein
MAGMGPPPKPAHLRQRSTTKKAGHAVLTAVPTTDAPDIPNPDGRGWHLLTLQSWARAWRSEMATKWLDSDVDGLGRLAILWDEFYKEPKATMLAEIRLQEQRFGLSPLDRTRLQWEINKADESERRKPKPIVKRSGTDPRAILMAVK